VLLVVYTVFSEATLSGIWHQLTFGPLLGLFAAAGSLLALMLAITALAARGLGFSREDQIAIVFCGSKKSLVTGIPDGEFAVCRPFDGPHRPAVDGVLLDPAHGLRRARPIRQGCEIARNSHPLR
jgi:solute carrier family 10 (sodium/bile acid cotransporter), member 7